MTVQAQQQDSTESKFFVGVGLSTTGYQVMGKPKYLVVRGIAPIVNVYFGYQLSKRSTLQVGLGYGMNETSNWYNNRYVSGDSVVDNYEEHSQNIKAVVVPVTFKFTPFNPDKRLQLYANASMVPVLGHIKARASEDVDGSTTLIYDEKMYSVSMIATAGLTLNYRFSKRLDAYIDGILFYKNFQFDRPNPNFLDYASAGIGLNYRL